MGSVTVSISGLNLEKAITDIKKAGIAMKNLIKKQHNHIIFDIDYSKKDDLFALFENTCYNIKWKDGELKADNYTIAAIKVSSIKKILIDNKKRVCLFVAILIALVSILLFFTSLLTIKVSGNERITQREIENVLSENGIKKGLFFGSLDVNKTQNILYNNFESITFVRVYKQGVALIVEIKEKNQNVEIPDSTPGDIYATTYGVIEKLIVYSGTPVVKVGDTVQSGDLIILGSIEGEGGILRCRASGDVVIRGKYYYEIDVTECFTRAVPTTEYFVEENIVIGAFKLSKTKPGGDVSGCISIVKKRYISDGYVLPIFIEEIRYYKTKDIIKIENENAIAMFILMEKLCKMGSDYIIEDVKYDISRDNSIIMKINCEVLISGVRFIG